ncbi:hypothetical protein SI65_05736 [Aspergillus cristatus]|uniref:Uncharacterized protein n=1 Tax=Aspergillus cristatus TaxID=573508 RepID=A0A1E3BDV6_ASPCR|nr:hypothetical protein SI65_05736 [Aspergillus cristatus]
MLDRDKVFDKEPSLTGGYVVSFNKKSTKWGTPEKAAVRATREEYVSPKNEQLIRTHHPALANQPYVSVKRDSFGELMWVVWETNNTTITPTHIAGRELHIVPRFLAPEVAGGCWPGRAILPDPISRRINPRRCLLTQDLNAIRNKFPHAIGIRILISGFALLVYHNVHDMNADWDRGVPKSIGGLTVGYIIKKLNPSVANKQDAGYYLAALTHMAMDAEKSLARFQLPEEFSELLDNVANEWAAYKDALDGEPAVTVSIETEHAPKKVQEAVVEGVKYHWCHRFRGSSSASLFGGRAMSRCPLTYVHSPVVFCA